MTAASLAKCWTTPHMDMYIPVVYTTWAGLAAVSRTRAANGSWTLDPFLFHAANLLFHAASSLLVYAILRKVIRGPSRSAEWAACAGAILFSIHPLQVEPVAWVSGLRDVLGGVLALSAAYLYLDSVTSGRRWCYVVGVFLFALSLLSKPSAMSLPLALAAIDYVLYHRRARDVLTAAAGWLAVAAAVAVVTKIVQPTSTMQGAPIWARPFVAADALTTYMVKILLPMHLGIDYGRSPEWLLSQTTLWWTWLPAVAVGGFLFRNRRRHPAAACAGAIFLAMLLPVLGLVKFEFQRHSTVADRYAYLAMLGPALLLAAMIRLKPTRVVGVVVGCILSVYAARAYAQTWTWKDSYSLFSHAVEANPTSLAGNNWLGLYEGQRDHSDRAIRYFRTAVDAHPADSITNYNLGDFLLHVGEPAEAVPYLRIGLTGRGEWFIHLKLATALARAGDLPGAIDACRAGIAQRPENAELHELLGLLLAQRGDFPAARDALTTALALNPKLPTAKSALAQVTRRLPPAASQPDTSPSSR